MTEQNKSQHPIVIVQNEIESDRMAGQLARVLPRHISVDKFQRTVITAVAKNPQLVEADRQSLMTACVEAASDGLLPNGKEAALVIYNTKVKGKRGQPDQWVKKVQYLPMIRGIYKKARNSGDVAFLDAQVVHEKDHFKYAFGLDLVCEHRPYLGGDRGAIIGAYAVAKLHDGTPYVEFMNTDEIEYTRSKSKTPDNGPWKDWWPEMARKTVVHRLAKRLPLSEEVERVVNRMESMYEFEKHIDNPPESRPHLADYAPAIGAPEPDRQQPQEEEPEPVAYPLVSEQGEVIEEITNGPGPWAEGFINLVKAAKTLKAVEALRDGNEDTINEIEKVSAGNANAAREWLKSRHDEIRAELDQKAAEREAKKKAEEPWIVKDAYGEEVEVKDAGSVVAMLEKFVKDTFPADFDVLFQNNTELLSRMDKEGMDTAVEWFEKVCEGAQESGEGDQATEGASEEPEARPEPPEEEEQPLDPQTLYVEIPKRSNGEYNWSSYVTRLNAVIVKCKTRDELEACEEANKENIKTLQGNSVNWHKSVVRALDAQRSTVS